MADMSGEAAAGGGKIAAAAGAGAQWAVFGTVFLGLLAMVKAILNPVLSTMEGGIKSAISQKTSMKEQEPEKKRPTKAQKAYQQKLEELQHAKEIAEAEERLAKLRRPAATRSRKVNSSKVANV
jgi:hypothetical protein